MCNCGSKGTTAKPLWEVTTASGEKKTYSTEPEAAGAAKRTGGTYRKKQ